MVIFVAYEFKYVADIKGFGGGPHFGNDFDVGERGKVVETIICVSGMCDEG